MENIVTICEQALNSKPKEFHYRSNWGNPIIGYRNDIFTVKGNLPIYTRAGYVRRNAICNVSHREDGLYRIDVDAYETNIASLIIDYPHNVCHIVWAKVTSRTDITVLSDVALMLRQCGLRCVWFDGDGYTESDVDYFAFKEVAKRIDTYNPTNNY